MDIEKYSSVNADSDGLWLHTSKINGVQYSIELTNKNSHRRLLELWQKLYNKPIKPEGINNVHEG